MNMDDFIAAMESHKLFYLKGSDRKIYFKKDFSGDYILSQTGVNPGFFSIAKRFKVGEEPYNASAIFFYKGNSEIAFTLYPSAWEVDE